MQIRNKIYKFARFNNPNNIDHLSNEFIVK